MITDGYIVVLAASAGGLKALSEILTNLPQDFPAPIAIVQHLSPNHRSYIAEILSSRTPLTVKLAEVGDFLQSGTVHIAPPDKHLLVNLDGTLTLSNADKVRFVRPAGNVLFESVAVSFQKRAIAVVLTGMDGDGATGVQLIKKMGGTVIAQDEATSLYFDMPKAAITTGDVDFILPLNAIAPTLLNLVKQ